MSPFIAVVVAATCFAPNDAAPGWKQVALPDDARALAAPEGVAQFRSDEWVTVVDERSELFLSGAESFGGRTSFELTLGEGGRSLEVHFERPLRGAKVDVTAWGPMGAMTLMNEQRVGGATLALTWGANDVRVVFAQLANDVRAIVRAAIVDEDDLVIDVELPESIRQSAMHDGDRLLVLVASDDCREAPAGNVGVLLGCGGKLLIAERTHPRRRRPKPVLETDFGVPTKQRLGLAGIRIPVRQVPRPPFHGAEPGLLAD